MFGQVGARAGDDFPPLVALPTEVAAQIRSVDVRHHAIRTGEAIADWKFDNVRSSYQAILARAGNDPAIEEAIRVRLARITRDEQAARAARTIDEILAQSHRRDGEVAEQKQRVAAASRSSARAFSAVGYMQASTEKIDGRKLYVLIGKDTARRLPIWISRRGSTSIDWSRTASGFAAIRITTKSSARG